MKYSATIFIILIFSICGFAQNQEKEDEQIRINICQPKITEIGRTSSFQFSYIYRLIANENGSVKNVKEISDNKNYRQLMNDENVIPCIGKWKLKPMERYLIIINVGTTSAEKSLNISSKTVKIKFLL